MEIQSNVLLLVSDEHNPLYSSPYGHPSVQTPHMQRLADTGTLFWNAYCPSPLCLPSRAAFMAGRRVHELQTYSNCNLKLDPTPRSFGAELAQQGVYSTYIGKVHVYARGNQLGFSEMILPGDSPPPGDTNHRRNPMTVRDGASQRADGYGPQEDAFQTDLTYIDAALGWIRNRSTGIDQPWVLAVNLHKPHFPHFTTRELWDLYPTGGDLPTYGADCASAQHPYAHALREHFETDWFSDDQIRGLRRGYLGCVTFVDRQLGRLLAALEETGQLETTDVIYTSDHGEMLGKFGMWWKCSLYEDSVRVPCIASGPSFRQGATVDTPVDLHDLQASLFRSAGADRPSDWVGKPLQDIPGNHPDRVIFSEYHGHGARGSSYMVRQGRWKFIYYVDAPDQLFDLEADPDELRNLIDKAPQVARKLESELRRVCDPELENRRAEAFIEEQLLAVCR
jgi:choline-sulfatase